MQLGVAHHTLETHEMERRAYRANLGDRCFHCRSELFDGLESLRRRCGFSAVAYGAIKDDAADHRPGMLAAEQRGVLAPLLQVGMTKMEVRRLATERGLIVRDKPAAACLASRIPVGTEVTRERLARVEAAEEALRGLGLRQLRVRDRGDRARVEVGADELEGARGKQSELGVLLAAQGFEEFELAAYRDPGAGDA